MCLESMPEQFGLGVNQGLVARGTGITIFLRQRNESVNQFVHVVREPRYICNPRVVREKELPWAMKCNPVDGGMQCLRIELHRGGGRKNKGAAPGVEFAIGEA